MKLKKGNEKKDINLLYFDKKETKTISKAKIIGVIILVLLLISIIIIYTVYDNNEKFRNYMDTHILNKEVEEDNLKSIEIADFDKSNIFAYSNYIAILKNNSLITYNSSGKQETENKIEISNPLVCSNGKYLMLAEQDSSKLYLISDNSIKWENNLEGNITRINVNSNGYSSVILAGTAYKSVVILFDEEGNELFKTYLGKTIAVDTAISDDNKYLSIAEVNTSGTLIQSNIKIISIEKAQDKTSEPIVYTYNAPSNSLILNIKYQDRTRLVCQYDNEIHVIKDNQDSKISNINIEDEKITFLSIELDKHIVKNIEESSGIFNATTQVKIVNTTSQKEKIYRLEGITKELYCVDGKIALNLGSEVHFIDSNGWLIKKYISKKEIRKIVITDKIAGIVYRDKIEIIKL